MKSDPFPQPTGHCALASCKKEFIIPASATNKRFCCAEHKAEWHRQQRQKAMLALRKQEEQGAKK